MISVDKLFEIAPSICFFFCLIVILIFATSISVFCCGLIVAMISNCLNFQISSELNEVCESNDPSSRVFHVFDRYTLEHALAVDYSRPHF